MSFKYHKLSDEMDLRFYQTPKVLFTNKKYKKLGLAEKQFYAILRDRQELSRKNNWIDEEGNIYLIFTVKSLAELCNISERTVVRYKQALVKYELLKEVKQGRGKPNRIYIGKPEYSAQDVVNKPFDKKCQKVISRSAKKSSLEVTNCHPNDTEVSETESSDIKEYGPAKAEPSIPYKKIIEYLNSKTGRQFNFKGQANRRLIKARFNEGYTEDDFYQVIDIKTDEWLNTDMEKYLRPNTLFGNKFDGYLNQEPVEPVKKDKEPKEDSPYSFTRNGIDPTKNPVEYYKSLVKEE